MRVTGYMLLNGWGSESPAAAITDLPTDREGRHATIRADGPYRMVLAYEWAAPDLIPEAAALAAGEDVNLAAFLHRVQVFITRPDANELVPRDTLPPELF